MSSMRRVHVILNAKSGADAVTPADLQTLFAQAGAEAEVTELKRSVDLDALVRGLPEGVAVIAAGGDGTISAVAGAVVHAGRGQRLGVLAVGTLNHFARDLGLPAKLQDAVAVAAGEHTRRVDAAEANGRVFVNNASLGAYPRMVVDRERMKKTGRNKWASLVAASFRAFVRFKQLDVVMELADRGETRRCRIPFLFVGNNPYCLDGLALGSRERLDTGRLGLYLAPGATRLDVLRMALGALFRRIRQDPVYEEYAVCSFAVSSRRRRVRIALDGEVTHLLTPLRFKVLPGALEVLVPAPPEPEKP